MITAAVIALWYLAGVALFAAALYLSDPVITRRDVMASLLAGILGPINLMYVIVALGNDRRHSRFWDKPVWPRQSKSQSGCREAK